LTKGQPFLLVNGEKREPEELSVVVEGEKDTEKEWESTETRQNSFPSSELSRSLVRWRRRMGSRWGKKERNFTSQETAKRTFSMSTTTVSI